MQAGQEAKLPEGASDASRSPKVSRKRPLNAASLDSKSSLSAEPAHRQLQGLLRHAAAVGSQQHTRRSNSTDLTGLPAAGYCQLAAPLDGH